MDGQFLIDLGYKPGKHFAEMLRVGNALEDNDISYAQILEALDEIYEEATFEHITIPLQEPISYDVFLDEGNNEYEVNNSKAVFGHMDELVKVPTVRKAAVMPDACPAGAALGTIPVGAVVATENAIHPGMHSADICCSMFLTSLDMEGSMENASKILDLAQQITHFGVGGRKDMSLGNHHYILQRARENRFLASVKMFKAMSDHHGTQGDGNHFFSVGRKESTGELTIVTHHGSRQPGALLYKEGMRVANQFREKISPDTGKHNSWIPYDTDEGQWYWEALQIIREWTKYNHRAIHDEIVKALNYPEVTDRFWNEHNFVFKKDNLFYHAKGSTPMFESPSDDDLGDDRKIIPLNMGEPILIVKKDVKNEWQFAPHGAGRNYSRTQFHKMNAGKTPEQIMKEQVGHIDARFYTEKPDISELPGAYKNAQSVQEQIMRYNLAKIHDRILPLGSMMAGEVDKPWIKKKGK